PSTVRELQCFLGFANFYRRFIRGFSTIIASLTSMLRGGRQRLTWSPAASEAFKNLRERFTTAPILRHPDPELEFTVEVDASNTGIGAVLSQRHGSPPKLYPCAFYSRKLTSAKQNYDVGNRELLAMKAAFEEWRHWLEGARLPFVVLTDHRNLEYLKRAKRLNPQQARCPATGEHIIPSTLILGPVQWDIMTEITESQNTEPPPPECPHDHTYVPLNLRRRVMQWVHNSPSAGHPGITATIQLITNRFWWSSLQRDVINFVRNCSICHISKSSHQRPAGLLQPLPIPQRPWSHVSIDFITDLPNSRGFTTILTVIDRFSKACRLIPLAKLPTAFETAEVLMEQMFRFYGLPEYIVSDRGPQFTSRVWSAFCQQLNPLG
ncbi:hypothetical protein M9458_010319, partial [Cirrhinus mrigala]